MCGCRSWEACISPRISLRHVSPLPLPPHQDVGLSWQGSGEALGTLLSHPVPLRLQSSSPNHGAPLAPWQGGDAPSCPQHTVTADNSLSASHMEMTMKLLRTRLQSRLALHKQFASLGERQGRVYSGWIFLHRNTA